MAAKRRTAAGRRSVPRPDDGAPHDTLKSPYLWYGDFSAVQNFTPVSGSKPLAPKRCQGNPPRHRGPIRPQIAQFFSNSKKSTGFLALISLCREAAGKEFDFM